MISCKAINLLLHIASLLVVLAITYLCCYDYFRNEDLCEVSFKKYNKGENHIYPSLSMCFASPFVEQKFTTFNNTEINSLTYESYLLGRYEDEQMLTVNFEEVTIQLNDFLVGKAQVLGKGKFDDSQEDRIAIENITTTSFGMWGNIMKCFSFHVPYQKGSIVSFLHLTINKTVFPNGQIPSDGKGFQLYFHYPQQFTRSWPSQKRYWPSRSTSDNNYKMRLSLKNMEVLKRRYKNEEQCEQRKDYDNMVSKYITDSVKCKPPYWTSDENTTLCKNGQKLKEINDKFWDIFYGNVDLNPPCREIKHITMDFAEADTKEIDKSEMNLYLFFRDPMYKEIRQTRAYNIKMVIGDIGGYVGLLLGYALVNLPQIIVDIIGKWKNHLIHQKDGKRRKKMKKNVGVRKKAEVYEESANNIPFPPQRSITLLEKSTFINLNTTTKKDSANEQNLENMIKILIMQVQATNNRVEDIEKSQLEQAN